MNETHRQFAILDPVWIALPDGCRLAARIWLPESARERPVPAILEYVPHRRRDGTFLRDHAMHAWYAMHGYAGVRVDLRGSGDSDGVLVDEHSAQMQEDGAFVVAWLARQAWCSGAVGMIGLDWGGVSALQIAATRPQALKAVVAVCATDDRFADDSHFMGGAALTASVSWAAQLMAMQTRPPDPLIVGDRWRGMWRARLEALPMFSASWLTHQSRDAYWRHGSLAEDYGAITCPVLAVGGWHDGYTNAVPRLLGALKVPAKGIIGPWAHRYPHFGEPGSAIGFLQETKAWWDRWLRDEPNGVEDAPDLRVWIGDGARVGATAPAAGSWIAIDDWPPVPRTQSLHLDVGALSSTPAPEGASVTVTSPPDHGLAGGAWCPNGFAGDMPGDQREDDVRAVVFETPPLEAPLELLGFPHLEASVSADAPIAILIARLVDVPPDGAHARISLGVLNLAHRDGSARPRLLEAGQRCDVRLTFNACGYRLAAGHRLRLALATGYWPMVFPPPRPVVITLDLSRTRLVLPLRPESAGDMAEPFAPAVTAPLPDHSWSRVPDRPVRVLRRAPSDELVVVATKDLGSVQLADIDLASDLVGIETYAISRSEPSAARVETDWRQTLIRGPWRVSARTRTQTIASSDRFNLVGALDARDGEEPFMTREWRITVPRRFT